MAVLPREEYAIVLDFLPHGYAGSRVAMPIAQAIGETAFTLLELVAKEGVTLAPEERVYIGSGERDKIARVKRRLKLDELTSLARENLDSVLDKLIEANEKRIIEIINNASLITPRLHKLELIPGIGKKLALAIIENRPFSSIAELEQKTGIKNFKKLVKERILQELSGKEKYYVFSKPFPARRY